MNNNELAFKKDLSNFQKTIWISFGLLVIILWGLIGFLSYWDSIQIDALKKLNTENNNVKNQIIETKEKMNKLLQGNTLQEFKTTETALINYFTNRVWTLPKALILEFLEEITPPDVKYSGSIKIDDWEETTMDFYSTNVKGLGEYYYKLLYYEKLGLIKINNFKEINLIHPEKELLQKYNFPLQTEYLFSTQVGFNFVPEKIKQYYYEVINNGEWPSFYKTAINQKTQATVEWEDGEKEQLEQTNWTWTDWILTSYPIEPSDIPENITVKDVIPIHEKWRKEIEEREKAEREAKKNIVSKIQKDIEWENSEENKDNTDNIDNIENTKNTENKDNTENTEKGTETEKQKTEKKE